MSIALTVLVILLCAYAAAWVFVLWVGECVWRRWARFDSRADAVMRAKDRVAIHATHTSLIEMPAHLRTRDEMVAWMARELPKLTAVEQKRRL